MANDVVMRWRNRSSAVINATLQFLVIYRYRWNVSGMRSCIVVYLWGKLLSARPKPTIGSIVPALLYIHLLYYLILLYCNCTIVYSIYSIYHWSLIHWYGHMVYKYFEWWAKWERIKLQILSLYGNQCPNENNESKT